MTPLGFAFGWSPVFGGGTSLVLPSAYPTGLVGWEMASLEGLADGGAVASLINQVDGSAWGTQATGTNKPTFRSAGINNKPAVEYATDDFLTPPAGALSWLQNVPGLTYVSLVQLTSVVNSERIGPSFSTAVAATTRFRLALSTTSKWGFAAQRLDADATVTMASVANADTSAHVLHVTIDYANAKCRMWLDGALIITSNAFLTAGNTENTASARARFCADLASTAANFGNVKIRHAALWNRAYYDTDLSALVKSWCADGGITYAGV